MLAVGGWVDVQAASRIDATIEADQRETDLRTAHLQALWRMTVTVGIWGGAGCQPPDIRSVSGSRRRSRTRRPTPAE
jgi:hypothetical protein